MQTSSIHMNPIEHESEAPNNDVRIRSMLKVMKAERIQVRGKKLAARNVRRTCTDAHTNSVRSDWIMLGQWALRISAPVRRCQTS